MIKTICTILCFAILTSAGIATAAADEAQELVQAAVDYYRGTASVATLHMMIHRPDWERFMTLKAWTRGQKESRFTIIAPPKDKGNGTLKKGREMWTFNPKINRVIKLPPAMMSQSWMGSDFSNNDLAKSDSIIDEYVHTLERVYEHAGKQVTVVKSMPKPDAPVVWGMQKLHIREDFILLRQEFYDEDLALVKYMTGTRIEMLGGRLFPRFWQMQKAEAENEYTRLEYLELAFTSSLSDRLFTLSALKNPSR